VNDASAAMRHRPMDTPNAQAWVASIMNRMGARLPRRSTIPVRRGRPASRPTDPPRTADIACRTTAELSPSVTKRPVWQTGDESQAMNAASTPFAWATDWFQRARITGHGSQVGRRRTRSKVRTGAANARVPRT
jgi:hypothetical protein